MERRVPRAQLEAVTSNSNGLRGRWSRSGRNGDPVACGRAASTSASHPKEDVTVFLPRALLERFSQPCSDAISGVPDEVATFGRGEQVERRGDQRAHLIEGARACRAEER